MKENVIIAAESDRGKKFGAYISVATNKDAGDKHYTDAKAFAFSLSH